MVAVQGLQAVHNPQGQIDQLQQSNPEINKLWCALQSQQKPQQDKKTSDGQSGFCWYRIMSDLVRKLQSAETHALS